MGLVEGENFRFGRDRQGDIELLRQLCNQNAIALEVVDLLGAAEGEISSSRIRNLNRSGKLTEAFIAAIPIESGQSDDRSGRGRELGFPTANLSEVQVLLQGMVFSGSHTH